MSRLTDTAESFAKEAHKNQTEKDACKTPYIFHLRRVAALVSLSGGSDEEVAAAWLHDTIEDTNTNIEDIEKIFGSAITKMVLGCTDLPEWSRLSIADRKASQAQRVSKESESVRRIKLADQISGGELDAKNERIPIEERKERLHGVKKVAEACAGVSRQMDDLFNAVYVELDWFLNNS